MDWVAVRKRLYIGLIVGMFVFIGFALFNSEQMFSADHRDLLGATLILCFIISPLAFTLNLGAIMPPFEIAPRVNKIHFLLIIMCVCIILMLILWLLPPLIRMVQ